METGGTIEVTPAEREADREGPRERIYEPEATSLYDHHDAYRGRVVVLRDVTLQRTREETLEAIRSATEAFLDAPDSRAVAEIAVEAAQDGLQASYSVVALYDEEVDGLEPTALAEEFEAALREAGVEPDPSVTSEPLDREGRVREVFETETAVLGEPVTVGSGENTLTVPNVLVLPLGDHGVIGVGESRGDVDFDADEVRTARTLARSTETALVQHSARARTRGESAGAGGAHRADPVLRRRAATRPPERDRGDRSEPRLRGSGDLTGRLRTSRHLSEWVHDIDDLVDTVGSITRTITDEEDRTHSTVAVSAEVERRVAKVADGHDALKVEKSVEDGLRAVGDDLFGEVVENLLLNAIEHNDNEEPLIEVTAERRRDSVEIRIADDGPGIPEEFRESVFEAGVTSDDGGTIGFGLYFVKVMTEAYGGSVRFEANEPRGTVAVVTLPAADADGRAVEGTE